MLPDICVAELLCLIGLVVLRFLSDAFVAYTFSEPLVIFSGGMSYDRAGRTPSITVMNGKSTTVLEMEHNVVDFVVLSESPWSHGMYLLNLNLSSLIFSCNN